VLAREAAIAADGSNELHGLGWVTVGKVRAGRDPADPGAAADAGLRAFEVNRAWPSSSVENGVRRLHRDLSERHEDVAEVVRLGEACRELRPAVAT
jgi:hypothetical protein